MLNRLADLVRLRTFANTLTPPAGRVGLDALRQFSLGEQVRAQVEAALPDGTFRVAAKNQSLVLRLPFPARAGEVLQLTVTAADPRLQFSVAAPATAPAARLSDTARFITSLLGETAKLPVTAPAQGGTPLLAMPPGDHDEIAAELRNALTSSGLFYESHQAQWAAGDRPLTVLLQEPQAQLPPLTGAAASAHGDDYNVNHGDTAPHLPELPVHRDALNIVRHQLDALETRQIVWNGLIWHDQPIEWEVTGQRHAKLAADDAPWRTHLRLSLPRLGAIDATLLVAARGVAVLLHAATDATAATLADHRGELSQALRAAGVVPLSITIDRDESA